MKYLWLILLAVCFFSCKKQLKQQSATPGNASNQYEDEILQQIYLAQYNQNTNELISYLQNEFPTYRKAAAMGLAAIQDEGTIEPLVALLNDNSKDVRKAAAYALGQIRNAEAETYLMSSFVNEQALPVKSEILMAIGKCGTRTGLTFLTEIQYDKNKLQLLSGQMYGINHFALQKIYSDAGAKKAFQLIHPDMPERIRFIASYYFTLLPDSVNYGNFEQLLEALNAEGYVTTKANLATALGYFHKNPQALQIVKNLLRAKNDYRIKVNILQNIHHFGYQTVKETVLKLTKDKNYHVAMTASNYFINHGINEDVRLYENTANEIKKFDIRTNMLHAALKHADRKKTYNQLIKKQYQESENHFEKADLLKALTSDIQNYKFIAREINAGNHNFVRAQAAKALIDIRLHENFDSLNQQRRGLLKKEFDLLFKSIISSGDPALISIAAPVMRVHRLKFNNAYKNTYFLKQALKRVDPDSTPDTYAELIKTINYINGSAMKTPDKTGLQINWSEIKAIAPAQRIKLTTTKGDIVLQLDVNRAPASVAAFIRLVKNNSLNKNYFRQIIPNHYTSVGSLLPKPVNNDMVIWPVEYIPMICEEGTVGFLSTGYSKDVNIFLSNSHIIMARPKFNHIGKVVSGIKTLHKLNKSDQILTTEILDAPVL